MTVLEALTKGGTDIPVCALSSAWLIHVKYQLTKGGTDIPVCANSLYRQECLCHLFIVNGDLSLPRRHEGNPARRTKTKRIADCRVLICDC